MTSPMGGAPKTLLGFADDPMDEEGMDAPEAVRPRRPFACIARMECRRICRPA